jgi:hypothetical protein
MQLLLHASLASSMVLPSMSVAARPHLPVGSAATMHHTAPSDRDVVDLVDALQVAEQKANEDPASGIAPLRSALDRVEDLGLAVARDPSAHEARLYGLLALARAHLSLGHDDEANATMDEAIRVARGEPLRAKAFGPRVVELYEQRLGAPENLPEGQLVIDCTPACDVVLNATMAGSGRRVELSNVPLGTHSLQVQAAASAHDEVLDQSIELTAEAPSFSLEFAPGKIDSTTSSDTDPGGGPIRDATPADGRRRLLPRWAGIVGVATGAVAMIAGGVLLGFHGRCPDGSDPAAADACLNVLDTRAPGIALLAIGGAAFTGFGVALIVGETRDRRRRSAGAMLGYTIRF